MKHLLAFALYLALAVLVTWPMARRIETTVTDEADTLHLSWILDWNIHALTHAPHRIFHAPVFHPAKYPLAFSENLIGVAAAVLPFRLLGFGPVAVYNFALLLGLSLSAWAGYLLGWVLTRKTAAALMAGLLYGFVPYQFNHVQHLQVIWAPCVALLLAAILIYRRTPSTRTAALVAAALAANALMNLYYFLFGAAMLVLSLALIAIAERRDARFWLRLLAAVAVAGVALVPVLAPYWIVSKAYAMERTVGEALSASASPYDWLIAGGRSLLYGANTDPALRRAERELFPGLVIVALAAVALLRVAGSRGCEVSGSHPPRDPETPRPRYLVFIDAAILLLAIATYFAFITDRVKIEWHGRILLAYRGTTAVTLLLVIAILARFTVTGALRRALARSRFPLELWIAGLWIVIGFIGSLGMHTPFHTFLLENVPGFKATRVPARWAMVSYAGLAAWAACGMTIVAAKRWRALLFAALALIDIWPRIRWMQTIVEPAEADLWIARQRAGPVYLLPFDRGDGGYLMLYRSTAHHQPVFNGLSSFEPPLHKELAEHAYDARTLDILEANGCRFVAVRPEWCGWEAVPIFAWLRGNIANGRLAFVRKFEFGASGDWIFAVARNERRPHRATEELAQLLDGKPVRGGTTFGRMSSPKPYEEYRGPLEISGLAMSPFGIRSVTALLDCGRRRIPLPLFPRDDYSRAFPWYPQTPHPAFALQIPARPKGLSRLTDVQIEIVDGRGKVTMLRSAPITWR
jgi:hypothetical protein